jgi:tetratricopeptide (TPR) repeat protein
MSSGGCFARIRYASFLYLTKDFQGSVNQCKEIFNLCDPTNPKPLRIMSISCYELKDYDQALKNIQKVFALLKPEERISRDYEYYGKILVATNQDSLGIEQLKIALALEPQRADLLTEIANDYLKLKKYPEVIITLKQKISNGKEVKSADYFNLGRSYYYTGQYTAADSAFAKVNEVSPKYASGFLWRAKSNTQLDTTSENGLAKPHYEKYIELVEADSLNASKYSSGLSEAYGYLSYYYVIMKDNSAALIWLRKRSTLPLDADEMKKVKDAINQLEGKK